MTKQEFIEAIAASVQKYAPQFGIKVYSPIIAQACLESGYGTSNKAKHNNFFGMKYREGRLDCHSGTFVDGSYEQLADGTYIPITDQWYEFESLDKGVLGYFQYTNISRYSNLKGVTDPHQYLVNIKADGYATSLDYVDNVYNTLVNNDLTKYDRTEDKTMGFTNSGLVTYTQISPNKTENRNHKIDRITIHCVVGHCSLQTLGNIFAPESRQASSNYGIDDNGNVGMYVEEKDRSWCSSSSSNDHRAITIEVASDKESPYKITDEALNGTIKLCADICKRNGINKMYWFGDKDKSLNYETKDGEGVFTVHRWFANKSCPGDYLYNLHTYICDEVNKLICEKKEPEKPQIVEPTPEVKKYYRVRKSWEDSKSQLGAYSIFDNAKAMCDENEGYRVYDWNGNEVYSNIPAPKSVLKSNEEIAKEVINGKWGNGQERKDKLAAAGYDYNTIQSIVNETLKPKEPEYKTYTVQKGDSLWAIAAKFLGNGARYTEIKQLNGLTSNTIYSGQVFKIPNK